MVNNQKVSNGPGIWVAVQTTVTSTGRAGIGSCIIGEIALARQGRKKGKVVRPTKMRDFTLAWPHPSTLFPWFFFGLGHHQRSLKHDNREDLVHFWTLME
jgi:hypothetical protein